MRSLTGDEAVASEPAFPPDGRRLGLTEATSAKSGMCINLVSASGHGQCIGSAFVPTWSVHRGNVAWGWGLATAEDRDRQVPRRERIQVAGFVWPLIGARLLSGKGVAPRQEKSLSIIQNIMA